MDATNRIEELRAATVAAKNLAKAYRTARLALEAISAELATPARIPGQFPKCCTACTNVYVTEQAWNALPAASGGLYAMGLEWRNHDCGGTLCIELNEEN